MSGDSSRHRRQTEAQMVLGGFAAIIVVGGGLLYLLFGSTLALIGVGAALAAIGLFGLLWLLLRAMEAWARSE